MGRRPGLRPGREREPPLRRVPARPHQLPGPARDNRADPPAHPGITTHRGTPPTNTVNGLPTTTLARTLLDLAAVAPESVLAGALHNADRSGRLDLTCLDAELGRSNGHRGVARLVEALTELTHGTTDSELERMFLAFARDLGLPRPSTQVHLHGYRVDFFWPQFGLVVELDGGDHLARRHFERDRRKDAALQIAGLKVLRVTYRRLVRERAALAADLRALTACRAA